MGILKEIKKKKKTTCKYLELYTCTQWRTIDVRVQFIHLFNHLFQKRRFTVIAILNILKRLLK
jgi:hypothetical protein